jgi:hypothetical protein
MATAKTINSGIEVLSKTLYITPTGLKMGARGKVLEPSTFFSSVDKSTARKVRKTLRRNGKAHMASARRVTSR